MASMKSTFLLILSVFILSCSLSSAYKFHVGGKDGWGLKPSAHYSQWAQKNRFQVNDTLYFKYNKGSDSVLVVNKQDYDSCNTTNPIHKMDDGESTFQFDKSGPFFFISGNVENCKKGEKLIIVVLSPNHHRRQGPPSPTTVAPVHSPAPSHSAENASSPSVTAPTTSPTGENSPAPSPAHSGSMRFSGSIGVGVALVLGTFIF